MMDLVEKLLKRYRPDPHAGADVLATLVMAAREDAAFRKRLIFVLRLPRLQREPLVKTAVDEMRLRGEPADVQAAFVTLSTDDGARTALQLLETE
jgi:hypothetical protein